MHEAKVHVDGEVNALAVYFHLHLRRGQPYYSSGPDNPQLVAWSQSVRFLPTPVRASAGETLLLWASRSDEEICVGVRDVAPEAVVMGGRGGAAGDAVGFEQTEDGRWLALLRKDASVPSLRDTAAAPLRGGYATAVFPPVEVEEQSAR